MDLTRTFIGIRPPAELQQDLAALQMALKRRAGAEVARWTPPHELFLTLLTLGELTPENVHRVAAAIEPVLRCARPMNLRFEGYGGAPNLTQPKVAYIAVGGDVDALTQLHAALEQSVAPLHLSREVTALACYVPLGRIKHDSESGRSDLGRALRVTTPPETSPWIASTVELIKTDVGPAGPTLVTLRSYPLG